MLLCQTYACVCFVRFIHMSIVRNLQFVIQRHLPFQDPHDVDHIMTLMLPVILVLKLMGRAEEAEYIMKRHVVNAYHDLSPHATYWVEAFNPILYLLEIVRIQEEEEADNDDAETKEDNGNYYNNNDEFLEHVQDWVLDDANSYYSPDHLRLGHTLMGEICWRLGTMKEKKLNNSNSNSTNIMKDMLFKRSKRFLIPIARDDTLSDPFLSHSALAILNAM